MVRHVLERLDLSLNETKTHIVDATQTGFNFLGFTIQMSQGVKTGKPYPNVRPTDKSLKKIKARLTELTGRNLTPIPLEDIVGNVNHSLRGWANYFHFRNSSQMMSKVRQHAEDRLRTHLMKRHKVKDRKAALCRFSRRDLYERYGLVQGFRESGLELGACLGVKNIGKPCAGEPQARFDEGRLMNEQVCWHVVAACGETSIKALAGGRYVSFLLYPVFCLFSCNLKRDTVDISC